MENHGITDCLGEAMQIQVKRSFMLKSIYFIPWGHLGPTLNQKRAHTLECKVLNFNSPPPRDHCCAVASCFTAAVASFDHPICRESQPHSDQRAKLVQ